MAEDKDWEPYDRIFVVRKAALSSTNHSQMWDNPNSVSTWVTEINFNDHSSQVSPEKVAKMLGVSVNFAENILLTTTQRGIRTLSRQIERRARTRQV